MQPSVVLAAALILAYSLGRSAAVSLLEASDRECLGFFTQTGTTVLISADPDEPEYYEANIVDKRQTAPGGSVCPSKYSGILLGQPVAVVATNEGPLNAALCLTELLRCAAYIKEVIWTGTAGTSPVVGGVITPPACEPANDQQVGLGDVCVSPFSLAWECFESSWTEACSGFPNVCSAPEEDGTPQEDNEDYGNCVYNRMSGASMELADEIIQAARQPSSYATQPRRGPVTQAYMQQYFGNLSQATGIDYTENPENSGGVAIYDYTQCMETTSLYYWTGMPWDYLARLWESQAVNDALGLNKSASDMVGVTAEEGTGISAAMYHYHQINGSSDIPFVIMRGLSDYDHAPLYRGADGSWLESTTFTFNDDSINDRTYAFTRQGYSGIILSLLQSRCTAGTACQLPVGLDLGSESSSKR